MITTFFFFYASPSLLHRNPASSSSSPSSTAFLLLSGGERMDSWAAYWLTFRVLLCAILILVSIGVNVYLIKKYEGLFYFGLRRYIEQEQDHEGMLYADETWKTCSERIHPTWLMAYRMFAFSMLLVLDVMNARLHGWFTYYYYTQWTFTLSYIYFLIASILSVYGCYRDSLEELGDQSRPRRVASFWGYVCQILYQTLAGLLVITVCLYWFIVVPYLVKKVHMKLNFLGTSLHLANAVFFLGEIVLNNLRFPWFRIAYFGLWTCIYVVFYWILHAFFAAEWPYFFLDVSHSLSPLWYLLGGLLHIPCYGVIYLLIKLKHFLLRGNTHITPVIELARSTHFMV